ncbi:MAG: 4Fe-4S binding protein [Melioribacteraceae bacterium]|jgi:NADH:ubiquinone oxidoreductase subunit F (NADH-binding)/(2Fe-2S) ferredoxin|nr:4Fe-4S binding protein [Melioribacteraceae bacterium]
MNSFIEKCCAQCWHTDEKPCEQFIACCIDGPLCHQDATCKSKFQELNSTLKYINNQIPVIFIGMGTCGLASGADKVKTAIESELAKLKIEALIVPTGCIGYCAKEPIVDIKMPGKDRLSYCEVTPKDVPQMIETTIINENFFAKKLLGSFGKENDGIPKLKDVPFFKKQQKVVLENCGVINPNSIDEYIAAGGFKALDKTLRLMSHEQVINEIKTSGLRGRGGGGFLTGLKWEMAYKKEADKKYLICNADEGDPGAFMDRSVLESDPYRVVEGMIVAAYAIGASFGYIYCRAEYPLAIERLNRSIEKCREYGILGTNILNSGFSFDLKIKKGAGAFVCGEETALIASIEGKRGMPRPRPPYPSDAGLWGKPTVINNVETFANVPSAIAKGASWFSSIGTKSSKGTKVFALSGKIQYSGLVEVPMGSTLREIVFDIGGGIPDGKKFKAVQIGGPSGGCLPESVMDTQVDYESLKSVGAMMGSGGFVVMDEDTCMVDVAKYFLTFIKSESCGKCVPCREGTMRLLEIIERIPVRYESSKDKTDQLQRFKGIVHLQRLSDVIRDTSLCGLGQSAPNPILSGLRYFRDEYESHLFERTCEAKVCKELLTFDIDTDKCSGCGLCLKKCPSEAIIGEKKQPHQIIQAQCIKCGMCFETCRLEAIVVN